MDSPDEVTLEQFLANVERRAYRMAQIATGHSEEALDIVQDAMCKLVQKYQHRPAKEWAPLFHRILQNRIQDWYRTQKLRRLFNRDTPASDSENEASYIENASGSPTLEPARQATSGQLAEALEKALHLLPLRQQQAFLLRAWEGLDVAETAAAMGCSAGSVKTHYSRALAALRQRLGEHWP